MHAEQGNQDESKYHLLLWTEQGELAYEDHLKERPRAWCITFEYFIYYPHSYDQKDNLDAYVVIDLNKKMNK